MIIDKLFAGIFSEVNKLVSELTSSIKDFEIPAEEKEKFINAFKECAMIYLRAQMDRAIEKNIK